MRYFVIWPDGRKFGPAEENELLTWLQEGRITLDMDLEDETSGAKMKVGDVPGLRDQVKTEETPRMAPPVDPAAPGPGWQAPPTQGASYFRPGVPIGDTGASDVTLSWILSAIGLVGGIFCCCWGINILLVVLPIIGLVMANRAIAKGHPTGSAAKVFAIVCIVLITLAGLAAITFMIIGVSTGNAHSSFSFGPRGF